MRVKQVASLKLIIEALHAADEFFVDSALVFSKTLQKELDSLFRLARVPGGFSRILSIATTKLSIRACFDGSKTDWLASTL